MSAHAGYRWLYASCVRNLDEARKLRVDALLGMPGAAEAYDTHRAEQVAVADWDVG